MKNRKLKSIRSIAAASLLTLTLALTTSPARADHEQSSGNVIVPIATFVALGLLLNHRQHNRPRYGYDNGYRGHYHGQKRKHKKYKTSRRSYSQGGSTRRTGETR